MLELPTPIGSFTKVPIKDSREARLIFIGTSDTRSELPTTLGSISILPPEGPRVRIYSRRNFRCPIETSDDTLEHIHTH
jgi:hypothetical protein